MLLGIPIIASGNMTLESGLRDVCWSLLRLSFHNFISLLPLFTVSVSRMGWMLGWIQFVSRSGRVLEAKRKREELQVQQKDSFAQED